MSFWGAGYLGKNEGTQEQANSTSMLPDQKVNKAEEATYLSLNHRHLKNIDCLSHLVCFISSVNGRSNKKKKRKEEAYPWKAGASSGHITNLKQSILKTFDIYALNTVFLS